MKETHRVKYERKIVLKVDRNFNFEKCFNFQICIYLGTFINSSILLNLVNLLSSYTYIHIFNRHLPKSVTREYVRRFY